MRFVSVRELRRNSALIWQELTEEKDMVVTSNGKPIAILSNTSEDTLEESLAAIRRARALAAVTAMQQGSLEAGTDRLSSKEIDNEIKAARRTRPK